MMKQRTTAALLTTGLCLGIAGIAWAEQVQRQTTQVESVPVVTRLVLRNHTVTITAAPDGHRYTVGDASGNVLQADLTDTELEGQYPRLARLLQPAVADNDSTLMMWAPLKDVK